MRKYDDLLQYCQNQGISMTQLRKIVLKQLCLAAKPISAYGLKDNINQDATTKQYDVMSIYRALHYLLQNGLAHKIDGNNTYSACCHPKIGICQLFICQQCGQKIETHETTLSNAINAIAEENHFQIEHKKIEVFGLCHHCSR